MWSNFLKKKKNFPPDRPELPKRCSSSHWTIVVATYLISFLPACYHLRSQPASERALTLFRIKVRVCSLETFVSVILWVYASRQKKIGTSCAACASAGALFLSASVRISLQCINCSPIANIFAHIFLLHLPNLDLPRVGIVSWHRKLWFYGWLFAKPTADITCTTVFSLPPIDSWPGIYIFPRRDYIYIADDKYDHRSYLHPWPDIIP